MTVPIGPDVTRAVVRRCGDQPCTDCDAPVRRSAVAPAPVTAPGAVHNVLGSAGTPLGAEVRSFMEPRFGRDFSGVRVHTDAAAATSAAAVHARAYTVGSNIAFATGAYSPGTAAGRRLLAHELVHTVQQGGGVARSADLKVGAANDPAEHEADRIAEQVMRTPTDPSPAQHAVRPQAFAVRRTTTGPVVRRDLVGRHPVRGGEFATDLEEISSPGKWSGMQGTIKFTPAADAPDSARIRLLQTARNLVFDTKEPYVWTGGQANRMRMLTTKAGDVKGGYFVDHLAKRPRTAPEDPAVSPYYGDYVSSSSSKDGSKNGPIVRKASLRDTPGSSGARVFSFETVAKAVDKEHVYGAIRWGFTLDNPAKGRVSYQYAQASDTPTPTFAAAVTKFNEFYRNPGASTAPSMASPVAAQHE